MQLRPHEFCSRFVFIIIDLTTMKIRSTHFTRVTVQSAGMKQGAPLDGTSHNNNDNNVLFLNNNNDNNNVLFHVLFI